MLQTLIFPFHYMSNTHEMLFLEDKPDAPQPLNSEQNHDERCKYGLVRYSFLYLNIVSFNLDVNILQSRFKLIIRLSFR